jgi:hypothetical protein
VAHANCSAQLRDQSACHGGTMPKARFRDGIAQRNGSGREE